jgi:ferredoxin
MKHKKHKYLKNIVTLKVDMEKCTGCGICTTVCPHNVLQVENNKISIIEKDSCMECGACAKNCPFAAITVDAGVGCAFAIINGLLSGGPPSCDCDNSDKLKKKNNSCC